MLLGVSKVNSIMYDLPHAHCARGEIVRSLHRQRQIAYREINLNSRHSQGTRIVLSKAEMPRKDTGAIKK